MLIFGFWVARRAALSTDSFPLMPMLFVYETGLDCVGECEFVALRG